MPLDEQHRSQLDSIVQKMTANGEPPDKIRFVVGDFKSKYDTPDKPDTVYSESMAPSSGNEILDAAKGFVKSAGRSVQGIGDLPHAVGLPGLTDATDALYGLPAGASKQSMQATNPAQKVGGYAETATELAPIGVGLATEGPGIIARAAGISKARAVSNLQSAASAAKNVVVDSTAAAQAAAKALENRQVYGRYVPRVVDKFLAAAKESSAPATNPFASPLTFDKARKFYSGISEMSADEFGKIVPSVKHDIVAVRQALHQAILDAATSVGKGEEYAKGIKEYARYSQAVDKAPVVAKVGAGAIGAGSTWSLIHRLLGK